MKLTHLITILIMLSSMACSKKIDIASIEKTDYYKQFNSVKKQYPFEKWKTYRKDGLSQYTDKNCNKAKGILDTLIINLSRIGESAPPKDKVKFFKKSVLSFNDLNDRTNIIETGEREQLFILFEQIAKIAGIDTSKYGAGEGIASEWRDW